MIATGKQSRIDNSKTDRAWPLPTQLSVMRMSWSLGGLCDRLAGEEKTTARRVAFIRRT